MSSFFLHHRFRVPKTNQQTYASVCRPFPCSSRRISSPSWPLTLQENLWCQTFWRNWCVVDDSNYDLGICPDPFFILSQISEEAAKSKCVFPEHSKPACIEGQGNCGFTCTDGFTPSYDSNPPACVCAPPSVLCNGVCKESGPCPSANATPDKKKRWFGSGSCAEKGMGWAACGVYGGSPSAWECVNTARDLESCTCLSNTLLTLRVFVP